MHWNRCCKRRNSTLRTSGVNSSPATIHSFGFTNYKVDQADLRTRSDPPDKKIASKDIKISSLDDRVSSLTPSFDAYKLVRNRFISTSKRHKLVNADRWIMTEGNG